VVAATIAQGGVLAGMQAGSTVLPILELQALVAAFTLVGLFLGVMSDERRQSEDSLRQSLRLAAAGEMAGAIAHEVNQPLAALAVYGESAKMLLERDIDRRDMQAILAKMIAEVQRTAEVMRRLKDLFDSGTTRLERVEVADLLEAARRIGQSSVGNAAIALDVEPPPPLPALFIDRVQVQLVLRNLLANSVDSLAAAPRNAARIRVTARPAGADMVRISVCDNGPGIAAPARPRLFEPFVSGKSVGMGLGLAVSRAIAEAHGGSLEAVSGEETQFHLVLPCVRTD
jgi:C4-dicarboxylate-specific signal transduction histidine kinase